MYLGNVMYAHLVSERICVCVGSRRRDNSEGGLLDFGKTFWAQNKNIPRLATEFQSDTYANVVEGWNTNGFYSKYRV